MLYLKLIYIHNNNMSNCTNEQKLYINYNGLEDTKLIACAGAGKTASIIYRIDNCITSNYYKSENILVLTFSRFTKDDFVAKIKKYKINTIAEGNIKTIDSFAKILIDPNNNIDVSLLSYRFMKYLEEKKIKDLNENEKL